MPEKNFEQHVQQTLDELRVVPGGKVWEAVDATLNKDRRRRILIFWLPLTGILLLLGIGTAVYFSQHQTPAGELQTQVPATIQQQPDPVRQPNTGSKRAEQNDTPIEVQKLQQTQKNAEPETVRPALAEKPAEQLNPIVADRSLNLKTVPDRTTLARGSKKNTSRKATTAIRGSEPEAVPFNAITPAEEGAEHTIKASLVSTYLAPSLLQRNAIPNPALPAAGAEWVHAPWYVGSLPSITVPDNRKWHWGVQAGAGRSGLSNGGLLSFGEKSLMMDNTMGQTTNLPPPPVSSTVTTTSGVQSGTGWSAGFWVSRSLNKRVALLSGLEFVKYNTRQWVGNGFDSIYSNPAGSGFRVLPGFYRGGDSARFRNRYNYFELPLLLQWRINPRAARLVTAEAGLSLGFLLNAKAMNYYSTTGAFHQETTGYNSFNAALRFSAGIQPFRHTPLSLHTQVKWNLISLRPDATVPSHLWNFGLNLRYTLH